jgi:hypothetical protein
MGWRELFSWNKPQAAPAPASPQAGDKDLGDRLVLDELAKAGANLELPREIVHYLYLTSRADATVAAENLQLVGYSTAIGMDNSPDNPAPYPFLVRATARAVANRETIREARRIFEELAGKLDGDYDGWEAAARP